ncbi:MAG: pseudouridine synthase [Bacteroidales bacterium]|jgi:tRNA pseudouridine65 synthase|nr:pseudouridine synthase [Bacteroidales bacterium]
MKIIYQDEEFAVLDKEVDLPVTHNSHMPKDAVYLNKLAGNYFNKNIYNPHRLDAKTSGLIILCFNKTVLETFNRMFRDSEIEKNYTAVVKGDIPESGVIDKEVFDRKKRKKLSALTEFEREQREATGQTDKNGDPLILNLLKIKLHTGRWHQIRQHLSSLKYDIIGDTQHGDWDLNKKLTNATGINRICLHASELSFVHPDTGKKLHLKSEIPEVFYAILNFKGKL